MVDRPSRELPDGYTIGREYSPPGPVIPLLQFGIFLGSTVIVPRLSLTELSFTALLQPLIIVMAITFILHELIHAGTELLLGYNPRIEVVPPRSLGPTSPVRRSHMLLILLMPFSTIGAAASLLFILEFLPPLLTASALIFNAMVSVADIWAAGVLVQMPYETLVLIGSTTQSGMHKTWLLVPDHD